MEASSPNPDAPVTRHFETDAEGRVTDPVERERLRQIALDALAYDREATERDFGRREGYNRALSGAPKQPFEPIRTEEGQPNN